MKWTVSKDHSLQLKKNKKKSLQLKHDVYFLDKVNLKFCDTNKSNRLDFKDEDTLVSLIYF